MLSKNHSDKMKKIKPTTQLLTAIILTLYCYSRIPIMLCNPIAYDPRMALASMPLPAASMPIPGPMMMRPQFDPFGSMAGQFMLVPPSMSQFMPMSQYDTHRRSNPGTYREDRGSKQPKELTDEQKALGDLPVSFIDPEEPQTITERISDSFSAIGEGVKNHFRSLTENFSDTVDDIKDAWRMSDNKRG